jgi:hypothetical protein
MLMRWYENENCFICLLFCSRNQIPKVIFFYILFGTFRTHVPLQSAVILQRRVERVVHDNKWLLFAGRQAFRSFVRAYATHSLDTKGIFSVQLLHLGHVAKSFGLRETPKALRCAEDVIGKIFNGAYSVHNSGSNAENRRDKYRAGGGGGGGDKNGGKKNGGKDSGNRMSKGTTVHNGEAGGKRKFGDSNSSGDRDTKKPRASTQNPGLVVKSGKDRQQLKKMGKSKSSSGSDRQDRKSSGKGKALTASGAFRKTSGYFKKKLRSQMSSEFSSS